MQNTIASIFFSRYCWFPTGKLRRAVALCLLIAITVLPLQTARSEPPAPGIEIQSITTTQKNGLYYLDAQILYLLSNETIEALHNGVRLNFAVEMRVFNHRYSWWRREKASLTHRYTLRYHALSQQYSLYHVNSDAIVNYPNLSLALADMGTLRQIPLVDNAQLDSNRDHFLEIRSRLEIESLPLPLRSMAYLNQGWILNSDWSIWALKE